MIVGSVGWGAYKRRTIVGDAISSFASRVEAANKNVGTSFLISGDAYEQAGHEGEVNQCPHGRFAARRVSTSSMKSSEPDRIPGDARAMS